MFKKFFLVLTLCLGVFGSTVFAATVDGVKLDDKTYYAVYTNPNTNKIWCTTFNKYSDGKISDYYWYSYENGVFSRYSSQEGYESVSFDSSSYKDFSTNNYYLYEYVSNNSTLIGSGSVVDPPLIAPTVEKAIQGIPTQFLANLKVCLPVGVSILAILLGVSLIPRLRAWFL